STDLACCDSLATAPPVRTNAGGPAERPRGWRSVKFDVTSRLASSRLVLTSTSASALAISITAGVDRVRSGFTDAALVPDRRSRSVVVLPGAALAFVRVSRVAFAGRRWM